MGAVTRGPRHGPSQGLIIMTKSPSDGPHVEAIMEHSSCAAAIMEALVQSSRSFPLRTRGLICNRAAGELPPRRVTAEASGEVTAGAVSIWPLM